MKSIPLTETHRLAVENYLLGTELSICAALHACYIDAEEEGYFAEQLDSVSQRHLEERIFKCALCSVWSRMFDQARTAMLKGESPACEICLMSPADILYFDIKFVRACGIHAELLRTGKPMGFLAILFNKIPDTPQADCRLQVTDADLDFLFACGIRARLSPEDAARRKLVMDGRERLVG